VVNFAEYQKLALSLKDVKEVPHFENPSFRVKNKIFATYWKNEHKAMVLLTPEDQSVFCGYDQNIFYPVNGSWGIKGATFVNLKKARKDMFKDALFTAYSTLLNKIEKSKKKKK